MLVWASASGCGSAAGTACNLPAGTYRVDYTRVSSGCAQDVIQPQWTEERTITTAPACGDRDETRDRTIAAMCAEICTERQKITANGFSGTAICDLSCQGQKCKYEATFVATKID